MAFSNSVRAFSRLVHLNEQSSQFQMRLGVGRVERQRLLIRGDGAIAVRLKRIAGPGKSLPQTQEIGWIGVKAGRFPIGLKRSLEISAASIRAAQHVICFVKVRVSRDGFADRNWIGSGACGSRLRQLVPAT